MLQIAIAGHGQDVEGWAGPRRQGSWQRARRLRHWLAILNLGLGVFLAGALLASVLAAQGLASAAGGLYVAYHLTCHQWAFRSFFHVRAPGDIHPAPTGRSRSRSVRHRRQPGPGLEMAVCERVLAIYAGLLVVGLLYARRRHLRPAGFGLYGLLILPMALDGIDQEAIVIPVAGLFRLYGLKDAVQGFNPYPSPTNQWWNTVWMSKWWKTTTDRLP